MPTDSQCPATEPHHRPAAPPADTPPHARTTTTPAVAATMRAAPLPPPPPEPSAPTAGDRPTGVVRWPEVGRTFLGFRLLEEIGRGAFSRVYLARQGDLADRPVVLKVTADAVREAAALARLQHTNIVPVHSVHRTGPLHAVCMPYLGTVTLADVYRDLEGMPTLPSAGRELFTTLNTRRAATLAAGLPDDVQLSESARHSRPPILATLAGGSYVEAVLGLAARVADGLAHAHDRGVVHRDLKPANILLADDGQPMLLDFNLAGAAKGGAEVGGGGTPPYMSPEQLAGFAGRPARVDGRSDLYSLGLVLFELLTRRTPFRRFARVTAESLAAMTAERHGPPPAVRPWNRAVSPAVEAIIRHLLEPDPDRRYPSARALKEDIERHLADLPLKHAPNPSVRERVGKWRRRNRAIASTGSLVTAGLVAAAVLAGGYAFRGDRLARMEAADALRRFAADAQTAQLLLVDRNADRRQTDDGIGACEAALARFGVLDGPGWQDGPLVARLAPADRDRLRDDVGGLLVLLARTTARRAVLDVARADPRPDLARAAGLCDAAAACYPAGGEPRAVWEQRAELARLLGRPDEAGPLARRAADAPAGSPTDRLLLAHQYAGRGEYRAALPLLKDLTRDDPGGFVAWFVRGVCHLELLQDAEAVGCFNSCVALRPDYHWAWYNRGLAARRQRQFEPARADFDRVIALRPGFALGYVNRAVVRRELGDHAGAADDLTRALDLGGPAVSLLFRRAAARRAAGDAAGADRDLAEAARREPTDEDGYVDRGLSRVGTDPATALADFDAALRLNPQSYRGLQNKAAVLADKFGREAAAVRVLDEAVRLYPDAVAPVAGRAVLLARAGQGDRAVADAEAALRLDPGPATLYRAGCVYALLSAGRPEHRPRAVQLLTAAVKRGYGYDLLADDPDLAPLRGRPEFRQLADAARALGGGA
jgi:serine/threonine protein kinase/tetratricopeptide (TPR) repeat protein